MRQHGSVLDRSPEAVYYGRIAPQARSQASICVSLTNRMKDFPPHLAGPHSIRKVSCVVLRRAALSGRVLDHVDTLVMPLVIEPEIGCRLGSRSAAALAHLVEGIFPRWWPVSAQ